MRVIIPSYHRAANIGTHRFFDGCYTVVVHTDDEKALYCKNPTIDPRSVVVSGVATGHNGLTLQREWVCQNLAQRNEWFLFADDDIVNLTAVPEPFYRYDKLPVQDAGQDWAGLFAIPCGQERFWQLAQGMVARAERTGARMAGFATNGNFFFRGVHWRSVGYVLGSMYLLKNVGVPYNHSITMEDFCNTAEHLLRFGAVLINNFVFPEAAHYIDGGMGKYIDRLADRKRDVRRLMALYPGLFRVRERAGFESGSDLAIRLTSPEQVDVWRRQIMAARLAKRNGDDSKS